MHSQGSVAFDRAKATCALTVPPLIGDSIFQRSPLLWVSQWRSINDKKEGTLERELTRDALKQLSSSAAALPTTAGLHKALRHHGDRNSSP